MNQARQFGSVVAGLDGAPADAPPLYRQKHFHVNELAELWGTSAHTVRRWFEDEPDVLRITVGYRRGKDHKVCLRIPESVAERVHRQRCRADV